jgi:hypothetical protein
LLEPRDQYEFRRLLAGANPFRYLRFLSFFIPSPIKNILLANRLLKMLVFTKMDEGLRTTLGILLFAGIGLMVLAFCFYLITWYPPGGTTQSSAVTHTNW